MQYELMFVLRPDFSEEELPVKIEKVKKLIVGDGGEVVKEDAWGKRALAYPIHHFKEGVYHFLEFKFEPSRVKALEKALSLDEAVLRSLIVR